MKWLIRMLIVVLGSSFAVLIGLALLSDRLIFQPQASTYTDDSLNSTVQREGGRLMHIISGDQRITAIYLPNPAAKYALLFSHGNAEDLGDSLAFLQMFREAGFAVFAYDYRGYGTSTGRPSEKGVHEDESAAYRYLTDTLHVSPDRVLAMGRSVGSAPAIHLAAHNKVAGLIAEAPFISAFRVLTRVPLLPWDKFNNLRDIRKVHAPVLIIQGRNDEVIPFWHGEKVFAAANEPKQFVAVDGAHHNDVIFIAGKKYFESLQQLAASLN